MVPCSKNSYGTRYLTYTSHDVGNYSDLYSLCQSLAPEQPARPRRLRQKFGSALEAGAPVLASCVCPFLPPEPTGLEVLSGLLHRINVPL